MTAPRRAPFAIAVAALALAPALAPGNAHAGPWMRDPGRFYINLTYSGIVAEKWYQSNFERGPWSRFSLHTLNFYGEVGAIPRWLTVSVEGQLFRHSEIERTGYTQGMGDLRLGFWSGLLQRQRVRLAAALLLGVPSGDPMPKAPDVNGVAADIDAQHTAASLPTGDGEVDIEGRLAFGTGFGRVRRWPLEHYLVAELGYRVRTRGFADDLVYKIELGTKIPVRVLDRIWLAVRLFGIESFASEEDVKYLPGIGIGNGVTYTAFGVELQARLVRGFGVNAGVDGAFRGRLAPAALNWKAGLYYDF